MASIDNLNFSVILDDKNFKKQIEADLKLAKDFNIQLSDALEFKRGVGANNAEKYLERYREKLNKLRDTGQKLTKEQLEEERNIKTLITAYQRQLANYDKTTAQIRKYTKSVKNANKETDKHSRYLSQMTNMIKTATSAYAAKEIVGDLIRITGEFEKQRVALRSILQDMTGADMLYEKIQALAVESPFQFKELISYTKQLAAFSVPLDELYDTTKMLADVSSGLGVGMDRLILAYGQIRSAAFLRGTEVRQLTEAGVPILEELRKKFEELGEEGVTVGDVFDKISARMVPFEMVKEVFEDMTSAGGMFYQMQEVQAQTLAGKISNLRDAYEVMFAEIGGKNERVLKGMVDWVRRLIQNYDDVGREIVALIATYGLYRVALTTAMYHTTMLARAQITLTSVFKKASTALAANPYAAIAAGIAAVGYSIYKIVSYESDFDKVTKAVNRTVSEFNATMASETSNVEYLFGRLEKLTAGTQEYNEVRSQILKEYGTYLTAQDKEAISVGNLTEAYDNLIRAITEANKEKFLQQGITDIGDEFQTSFEEIDKALDKFYRKYDIEDKGIRNAIADYVFGRTEDLGAASGYQWKTAMQGLEGFSLGTLRYQYYQLTEYIKSERQRLADELRLLYGPPAPDDVASLSEWQEKLQGFLTEMGKDATYSWWTDDSKNQKYFEYVDNVRKRWAELGDNIKDAGKYQSDIVASSKTEMAELEKIAQFLGFGINPQSGGSGTENDQLAKWRIQVQWLQELQKQYQTLSQYADNATLSPLFMGRYGEDINSILSFLPEDRRMSILVDFDFEDNLLYMASEIRKVGTDAALALAEQIERSVGGDWASVQEGLFKAVRDYADFIKEWGGQDFMLDGKGVAFDLTKVASDYNNAIKKVTKTRDEAIGKAAEAAERNGVEWYNNELARIAALYGMQMDYEKRLRQEKIRELGTDYAKELIAKRPEIITEDFGDASLRQIEESMKEIDGLIARADGPLFKDFIPLDISRKLKEAGLSLEEFGGSYKEALKTLRDKNASEYMKLLAARAQQAMGVISTLGGTLSTLGSELGNSQLERLGENLSKAADGAASAIQAFADGDKVTGIISLITTFLDAMISKISEAINYTDRLIDATREYQEAVRELAREDYDTIFGTDELGRFMNDLREARGLVDDYNKSLEKATGKNYANWGKGNLSFTKDYSAVDTLAMAAGFGYDSSSFYNNGVLDMEKVKAYFEQVGDEIPKKQRKVLEELIENYDYMNEYMGYENEYLTQLFGDLASNIADVFIENWMDMGDTVEDEAKRMEDIFYDLGEAITRSLLQSFILNTVLKPFEERVQQLYADAEESGDWDAFSKGLSDITEDIKERIKEIAPALYDFLDQMELDNNLNRDDYNSIDTVQGNLSEETMNRVLNIVNAMRAEQFRQGMRIDNIDVTLVSIAGLLGESRDQYLNYLAQISANTANTAQRMQQWLDTWGDATTGDGRSGSLRVRIVN